MAILPGPGRSPPTSCRTNICSAPTISPTSPAHYINTDHAQQWTGSAGASYLWHDTRFSASMVYGSGLRADLILPDGSDIPNSDHVAPYATANIGISHEIKQPDGKPVTVRFDVVNVFDTIYELGTDLASACSRRNMASAAAISSGFRRNCEVGRDDPNRPPFSSAPPPQPRKCGLERGFGRIPTDEEPNVSPSATARRGRRKTSISNGIRLVMVIRLRTAVAGHRPPQNGHPQLSCADRTYIWPEAERTKTR